jgi:hypothetical protein
VRAAERQQPIPKPSIACRVSHPRNLPSCVRHVYVASYPRILAMARLTHLPHSMLVTSTLPFSRHHPLISHYQTPRGHCRCLGALPLSTPAIPNTTGAPYFIATTTYHSLRRLQIHIYTIQNLGGSAPPSLGPYRTLPITNTLPSSSYSSTFFPIFSTLSYFLHQWWNQRA